MKRTGFAAIACAAMLTVACGGGNASQEAAENEHGAGATNQTTGMNADGASIGTAGEGDRAGRADGDVAHFVEMAGMHGTAEVQLGQLASERGQSADVKQYGQMMVKDHTKANDELKQAASAENLQVPARIDEKHQELAQRLSTLQGAEFDREYIQAMVDGHEEMRDMLTDRTRDAGNTADKAAAQGTAVNQWALKTLPAVEQHLQKAQQIQEKLNNRNTTASR